MRHPAPRFARRQPRRARRPGPRRALRPDRAGRGGARPRGGRAGSGLPPRGGERRRHVLGQPRRGPAPEPRRDVPAPGGAPDAAGAELACLVRRAVRGRAGVGAADQRGPARRAPLALRPVQGVPGAVRRLLRARRAACRCVLVRAFNHVGPRPGARLRVERHRPPGRGDRAGPATAGAGGRHADDAPRFHGRPGRGPRVLAGPRAGTPGEVYNVASGRAVSIQEVVDGFLALASRPIEVRVAADRVRPIDLPLLLGDAGRLRARTGWKPQIPSSRAWPTSSPTGDRGPDGPTRSPGEGAVGVEGPSGYNRGSCWGTSPSCTASGP